MVKPVGSAVPIPRGVATLLSNVADAVPAERAVRAQDCVERMFFESLRRLDDGTVFVATGDIPAMWLRDSTWQMRPLLAAAVADDETCELIADVSRRQAQYVQIDPYANAFNSEPSGKGWASDFPDQSPWVWERKYELDSLTSMLDLAVRLHATTGHVGHLDSAFGEAANAAIGVIDYERRHESRTYRLRRRHSREADSLSHDGFGAPVEFTGLSWSGFRPSDDACELGYHVPSNAHAAVVLQRIAALDDSIYADQALKDKAHELAESITRGIREHAVVNGVLAYEVDGLGGRVFMDDANAPSLLSLPYLGWCPPDSPLYLRTRATILSDTNPWYVRGRFASGVGSAHTRPGYVWPLSIAIAALTSTDPDDAHAALDVLETTDAGTGRMHEAFDPNRPSKFTRSWFGWADMTYVHLVLRSAGLSGPAD